MKNLSRLIICVEIVVILLTIWSYLININNCLYAVKGNLYVSNEDLKKGGVISLNG